MIAVAVVSFRWQVIYSLLYTYGMLFVGPQFRAQKYCAVGSGVSLLVFRRILSCVNCC